MSNYEKILNLLQDLKTKYPSYNIGRHITTALSDYGDIWGLLDKEFLFALSKYSSELELDYHIVSQEYIDKVVEDAKDLNHILDEEDNF